jgi:hypothetical protein
MSQQSQTEVMNYTYHISSSERSSGSNTNFNINFSQIVNLLAKKGMFQIIFNSAQIPFTFYQMNNISNLNVISVTTTYPGSSPVNGTITINQGNYTPYTLLTELQNELYNFCYTYGGFKPVFACSYNPTLGYLTLGISAVGPAPTSGTVSIQLNFASSPNILTGGFFGISTTAPTNMLFSVTYVSSSPSTTVSATSTQPCVLNPINYLLIRSSLKQYRNREFITIQDDVSDIVYKVPITTVQSSWINYYQTSEPLYIVDNSIQSINFYLTSNLSYTPINLQNIPWAFSFTIREVIRPDYEAINSALVGNITKPIHEEEDEEERRLLEMEKEKQLQRLELYKKKLEKKGLVEEKGI